MNGASGKPYGDMPEQMEHGLRILARIIAREFIKSKLQASQTKVSADDANTQHLQDK